MSHQISRSTSLHVVPDKKLFEALENNIRSCEVCSKNEKVKLDNGICTRCTVNNKRMERYKDANIPVIFWELEMGEEFVGDPILKEKYLEITQDLKQTYKKGLSICFAGLFGRGKSLTVCNILKRAVEKNYSALYVNNMSDIISVMLNNKDSEDRVAARRELLMVDFLAIDEFDPRYISGDKSSDLFGKTLDEIFRTRSQNALPIFLCTNSTDPIGAFSGSIKQSLDSLMSTVEIVPVIGKDQRKAKGKK